MLLGSLGEGATLSFEEKLQIVAELREERAGTRPVVASVSALSTCDAVAQAKAFADAGCDGLMVLPPYVYPGDAREMNATFPRCSKPRRFPACSTTIRLRMVRISFRNKFRSWPRSTRIWPASRNPAPM